MCVCVPAKHDREYFVNTAHQHLGAPSRRQGLGTDDAALIEILCTLSNDEIVAVREEYRTGLMSLPRSTNAAAFETSMEGDIAGDTSGDYKDLLVTLCQV